MLDSITKITEMFLELVFQSNGNTVPKIEEITLEEGKVIAKYKKNGLVNYVIIDLSEKSVNQIKAERQTLFNSATTSQPEPIAPPPPTEVISEATEDEVPIEERSSKAELIFKNERVLEKLHQHVLAAQQIGEMMFINSDGTVCYPYNFATNAASEKLFHTESLTEDDIDEVLDLIIENSGLAIEEAVDDNVLVVNLKDGGN